MRRDLYLAGATLVVVTGALAALTRVLSDGSWRPMTAAALLLSLATAAGARRVGFGPVAAAVGSLVGLVVFTYVAHLPAGPLLPGREQLAQAVARFAEGLVQFRDQPAPTAPLPGLLIIITTAVWVVTHATHELLVRWRHWGLALLPPAVLWMVPLAVPLPPGRTWPQALPFLAGAALVLLLENDSDVAGFARDVEGPRLSGTGAAVGAVALIVAAVAPGALPGYGAEPWVDLAAGNEPRGYQPIVDVGDRLKLPEDRPLLEVQADRRTYLRLAALDTFDNNTWRLGPPGDPSFRPEPSQIFRADGPLPVETPLAERDEAFVQVRVLDLANIYVPVPYQPVEVLGPERDEMIYSTVGGFVATADLAEVQVGGDLRVGVTAGLEYRVRSHIPTPTIEQLRTVRPDPSEVAPYLQLPAAYDRLAQQARDVYAAADATTAVDAAFALQDWFAGPDSAFTYSTDVEVLRGAGALERFVFDTKVGYCEYYATAMAVMLRATGIPARVAVGFLPGRVVERADPAVGRLLDTYEVSSTDAHAWVEVLFPGYGWIRFEPTPRADGATMQPTPADLDPVRTDRERVTQAAEEQPAGADGPTAPPEPARPQDIELPEGLDRGGPVDATTPSRGSRLPAVATALLACAVAGLVVAGRRRAAHHPELSGPARVLATQQRLLDTARSYGLARRPSETVADVTARWAAEGRVADADAARLAALTQAAAFGGDLEPAAGEEAEVLTDRLVARLRASVGRRERLLAPVRLPVEDTVVAARRVAARARRVVTDA